jgi:hypothetical protein
MALLKSRKKAVSPAVKAVMKLLDGAARKFSMSEVRRATNRWSVGQRDRLRLAKERGDLEKKLAEVTKRLGG